MRSKDGELLLGDGRRLCRKGACPASLRVPETHFLSNDFDRRRCKRHFDSSRFSSLGGVAANRKGVMPTGAGCGHLLGLRCWQTALGIRSMAIHFFANAAMCLRQLLWTIQTLRVQTKCRLRKKLETASVGIGDFAANSQCAAQDVASETALLHHTAPTYSKRHILDKLALAFAELRSDGSAKWGVSVRAALPTLNKLTNARTLAENMAISYPYSMREAVAVAKHLESFPQARLARL